MPIHQSVGESQKCVTRHLLLLGLLAVALAATVGQASYCEAAADSFSISAKVLEAVEDGPVIVKLTLVYHGREPVTIQYSDLGPAILVTAPGTWEPRNGEEIGAITTYTELLAAVSLSTNGEISAEVPLHQARPLRQSFSRIPAGKATLKITWPIRRWAKGTQEREILASPSTFVAINVLPAVKIHAPVSALPSASLIPPVATPQPSGFGLPALAVSALSGLLLGLALAALISRRRRRVSR